jgi:hypothetical protein
MMTLRELTAAVIEIKHTLSDIRSMMQGLLTARQAKDWYSTAEVAAILQRAEYTVREHCRLGRIRASKKACGRGKGGGEWLISHAELIRFSNEGLLPLPRS